MAVAVIPVATRSIHFAFAVVVKATDRRAIGGESLSKIKRVCRAALLYCLRCGRGHSLEALLCHCPFAVSQIGKQNRRICLLPTCCYTVR
jgi:hypothetical protein